MEVIRRQDWGARKPKSVSSIPLARQRVWVHHSVTGDGDGSQASESAVLRQIQAYHMDSRGWSDIGYSFVIFPSGRIYEGRGWGVKGAHSATDLAPNENSESYGIAAAGDYTKQTPTAELLTAYIELIRFGIEHNFIVSDPSIGGHRDVPGAATSCPGNRLYSQIDTIVEGVRDDEMTEAQMLELKKYIDGKVNGPTGLVAQLKVYIDEKFANADSGGLTAAQIKEAAKQALREGTEA